MYLEKNLESLKVGSELLTKEIEAGEYKNPDWLDKKIRNKDKTLNWTIKTRSGCISIDNVNDPMDGKNNNVVTREKKPKSEVSILVGIGCGHILNKILEGRDKGHTIIIVEPVLELIKTALSNYDMSSELDHDILIASTPGEMIQLLSIINESSVIESFPITKEAYTLLYPETYGELIKETMDTLNNISAGVGTAMARGVDMAYNDIRNLPYCLPHPGVKLLKDLKKGCPIVMVSTGPSLSKNLMELKKYQENVFIVSAGQAIRILLSHGIRPDIACSVDFGEVNMSHYEGLLDQDIPLVLLNRTYAPLLQSYRGPKFVSSNNPQEIASEHSCSIINDKGFIPSGGSVAHFALSLSAYMGGSPIMIMGQDLALTGDKSHFDQADSSGETVVENGWIFWEVTDPDSTLYGQKNSMGPAEYVEGYFGEPVLTNSGLASFIFSFESLVKNIYKDELVINCTEGGANIKGMKKMSLRRALKIYASKEIDKTFEVKHLTHTAIMEDVKKTKENLKRDIKNMDLVIDNAEAGIRCNNKARVEQSRAKLKYLLSRNEVHSTLAHETTKKDPLLSLAIYHESRDISGADMEANGKNLHERKEDKDFETRLKRNKYILEAALKRAKELKELYQETKDLLDTVTLETLFNVLNHKVHVDRRPTIGKFKEYLEKGNYAYPISFLKGNLYNHYPRDPKLKHNPAAAYADSKNYREHLLSDVLKPAEKMRDEVEKTIGKAYDPKETDKRLEYNTLIEDARLLGRNKEKFDDAKKLLDKAIKLYPKEPTALWGLASAYHYLKEYKKSLAVFDRLIKKHPDNLQFQFEAGHVCLAVNLTKGFKRIGEVMEKTEAYDHYLAPLSKLYIEAGRPKEALTLLKSYTDKFPLDLDMLDRLKKLYVQLNEPVKAADILSRIESLSTTD